MYQCLFFISLIFMSQIVLFAKCLCTLFSHRRSWLSLLIHVAYLIVTLIRRLCDGKVIKDYMFPRVEKADSLWAAVMLVLLKGYKLPKNVIRRFILQIHFLWYNDIHIEKHTIGGNVYAVTGLRIFQLMRLLAWLLVVRNLSRFHETMLTSWAFIHTRSLVHIINKTHRWKTSVHFL